VPKASAANIDIEDNDDSSSANSIAVNVTHTDLSSDDEYDCFNFTARAGYTYEVILDSNFAIVDLDLQLYNSTAQSIGISQPSNNRKYIRVDINVEEIVTVKSINILPGRILQRYIIYLLSNGKMIDLNKMMILNMGKICTNLYPI